MMPNFNKEYYVKVSDIMAACREAAKVHRQLADKCISSVGKGESETSALGGAAYFLTKAEMYEFHIPNVIQGLEYIDLGDSKKDVRLLPLESLGLSTKAYNSLKRADINTLGDITNLYLFELQKIRNLGNKSLSEVLATVEKYGVFLKGEKEKVRKDV